MSAHFVGRGRAAEELVLRVVANRYSNRSPANQHPLTATSAGLVCDRSPACVAGFLPGVVDPVEHGSGHHDGDTVDAPAVRSRAAALLDGLDYTLRVVMSMKLAGASDTEVGEALSLRRRTAKNRKAAAYSLVEELLQPLTMRSDSRS